VTCRADTGRLGAVACRYLSFTINIIFLRQSEGIVLVGLGVGWRADTMTHIWRWLALVRVDLALELGSAALVTNADVTAHLVTSKYVHLHLIKHCGHLFGATVCLLSTTK
jgi:hypothetical protein